MEYIIRFKYKNKYDLCLGFCNWWLEHPYLFVRLNIPIENAKETASRIQAALEPNQANQKKEDGYWYFDKKKETGYIVEVKKKMLAFINLDKDEQQVSMIKFYSDCIKSLAKIKSDLGKEA